MHDESIIMANITGFAHIAFEVDDVAKTLELAFNQGAIKLGEVVEKEVENVGLLQFV